MQGDSKDSERWFFAIRTYSTHFDEKPLKIGLISLEPLKFDIRGINIYFVSLPKKGENYHFSTIQKSGEQT